MKSIATSSLIDSTLNNTRIDYRIFMSVITQSILNHSTIQGKATSRIKTNFTILWCAFMLHRFEKSGVLESYEYHLLSSLQFRESSHGSPIEINRSYLKPWIGMWFSYAQKPEPESICFTSLIHCKCFPEETGLKYFRTASVNCIPGGASIRARFKNPVIYANELPVHRPLTSIKKCCPQLLAWNMVFPIILKLMILSAKLYYLQL